MQAPSDNHHATALARYQAEIDAQDERDSEEPTTCQNSEAGNYGHECGSPAEWRGQDVDGYTADFCDFCKKYGHEARLFSRWTKL